MIDNLLIFINSLSMNSAVICLLKLLVIGLLLLIAIKFSSRFSNFIAIKLSQRKHINKVKTLTRICQLVYYTIVGFIILALFLKYVLLIDISSILTLAGIISIAVGYASQQIIQDFINGIILLLEESITLNDDIEVNGVRGIVEDINLHCIYVRDKDNNLTVIPCSKITNGYTNYTQDATENRTRILESTTEDYDYKNSDKKEGK